MRRRLEQQAQSRAAAAKAYELGAPGDYNSRPEGVITKPVGYSGANPNQHQPSNRCVR
jgi:hypothetical protein